MEMFPEHDRLFGCTVGFISRVGSFMGLTPMIESSLIMVTGGVTELAFYMSEAGFAAAATLCLIPGRSGEP
ncbi:hypothetical protein ACEN2J_12570 [Pseudorhodobacter sp. W20_MBD10_FR17]|uniref:hypothetical protein n=1 Tax=Pseudorhodobacter sp. W20_MBD10_FR17 TaxID=3240266 RepID=UPI003F9C4885